MTWLVLLLVAAGVVHVATRYARGVWRLPALPEPVRSAPDTGLRAAPRAADVDRVRFDTALRGYRPADVEARLARLRGRLEAAEGGTAEPARVGDPGSLSLDSGVSRTDPVDEGEPIPLVFRGYRTDQVDDVLDRLEAAVRAAESPDSGVAEGVGSGVAEGVGFGVAEGVGSGVAEGVGSGVAGGGLAGAAPDRNCPEPGTAGTSREELAPRPAPATRQQVGVFAWMQWPGWLTGERRPPDRSRPPWRPWPDAVVAVVYGLLAAYLLGGLIADPHGRYLSQGVQDQQLFEFYLGASAHNLATLGNPLFTVLQNNPLGVNLVANTGFLGLGVPLAPITLLAGPQVTFIVVEWLGFLLTALLWYRLFAVRLTGSRGIAFVGGLLCGFSPGMVSHGNGHPNFLAQFLVPVIIDRLLELQRPGRTRAQTIRAGVVLGLLVTWQLFLGEEVLLLASVGIAIVGLVLVAHRTVDVRAMLPGTLVGVGTTLALFGFPLWWQFWGPQSYSSLFQPPGENDFGSLWGRATRTFGADPWAAAALSMNRTEENAFFGVLLWVVAIAVVVLLWRKPLVRACAVLIVLMSWTSLGLAMRLYGSPTGLPSLWSLARQLPLIHLVVPTRFTLVAVPGFATLLVVGLEQVRRRSRTRGRQESPMSLWLRPVAWGVVVLALLPLVPTPLVADARPTVPVFFTSGDWRSWVHGGAVLPVPPGDIVDMRSIDWQAAARWGFPLPEGYFVGPDGRGTGGGQRGAIRLPLSEWLHEIDKDGVARSATEQQRAQFAADLDTWQVDAVVLPVDREHADVLLTSLESVLGPATTLGGVHVWDARALRQAPA